MHRLIFTAGALDDVLSARSWYEGQREGLGLAFERSLEAILEKIRRLPMSGKPIAEPFRRAMLRRFP